jgi:hypothetical protein
VWVLDRKKICEGLPGLPELRNAIDGRIRTETAQKSD